MGIMLKDIICSGEVEKDKSNCLLERHGKSFGSYSNPLGEKAQKFYKGREDFGTLTCVREYVTKDKSSAIMERYGANKLSDNYSERTQKYLQKRLDAGGFITMAHQEIEKQTYLRLFNQTELERLQGFPDCWTSSLSYNHASSLLGDGWTLPVIEHILSYIQK